MLITTKSPDFYLFQKLVVGVTIRRIVVFMYVRGTYSKAKRWWGYLLWRPDHNEPAYKGMQWAG